MAPASEPAASCYVRLRAFTGALAPPLYFNASVDIPGVLGAPLSAGAFYAALLAEQALWNATLVEYVAGGGCAVICAPGTYAVTSPYLPGGCHACTAANELVGTYARTPGAPPTVSATLALRQHL